MHRLILLLCCAVTLAFSGYALAAEPTKSLIEITPALADQVKPTSDQLTTSVVTDPTPGLAVACETGGEDYPGITITPAQSKLWDLTGFGHVDATITNTGDKAINLSLRVDNDGSWANGQPTNTESAKIEAGKTATINVIFGYQYGKKPGYKLDPARIARVLIFSGKVKSPISYRIESIVAGGPAGEKPPVDPKSIRIVPENGVILGQGAKIDPDKNMSAENATATLDGSAVQLTFTKGKKDPKLTVKPEQGRWDMRQQLQVSVAVKNTGKNPVTPSVRLESDRGPTHTVKAESPLAPGKQTEIIVPFANPKSWVGPTEENPKNWQGDKSTETQFGSDAVKGVTIMLNGETDEGTLEVTSIQAQVPPTPEMPEWLGKRPPVEGDWVQTFNDDFDGTEIDPTKWKYYGENYWDKKSHFSKENVIVGDGVVRLRFAKKRGPHNDDPAHKRGETDYATGFLESYGKFTQRYGYFESRMKLPTAPGLWPAFWLMPDRGVALGEQWKRADTAKGGMEFDVMEHLTRWGPFRFNVAYHWDGYQKNHKSTGSERIYVQPDKDGFITSGLLWTPGLAVYYCNGQEIARWEHPRVSNVQSDMMYTHVMGGWDNNALDDAKLPDDFIIDYTRVWQRKDLASEEDGFKTEAK